MRDNQTLTRKCPFCSYYSPVASPTSLGSLSPPPDHEPAQTDPSTGYCQALTVSDDRGRRDAEFSRSGALLASGPYDKLSSIRVDSESPEGRCTEAAPPGDDRKNSIREGDEANRQSFATESIGSMSVDLGDSCTVTTDKKKKSKGKRLKEIFKLGKPKEKSKGKGQVANMEESTRVSVEMNGQPKRQYVAEEAKTPLETSGVHSLESTLEPEFKRVILSPVKQPPETLPPPTADDNLVSTVEPEKRESLHEVESESPSVPPPVSAAQETPLSTTTEGESHGCIAPPEQVESLQLVHNPPTVGPALDDPVSTDDHHHLEHHTDPSQDEPPKSSAVVHTTPPPKPKRRTRAVQEELPATSASQETTADVSMDSRPTSTDSKELGLQHSIGTSHEDLTQISQDREVANSEERQNPSTQPIQNSTPQTPAEASPAAVDAEVFRKRSASIDQVLREKPSEPESPSRLRSFSVSPDHKERPPAGQAAIKEEESRVPISNGRANRRSPLARRHAFKAAQGPHLVSRKASQLSENQSQPPAKDSPKPPKPARNGGAPHSDRVSELHSPRRLKGATSSPLLGVEPPVQQPRVKRMSVPNEATTAASSEPPHKQSTQQSKPTKVSKLLSGSTPVLTDPRKTPGKKYSSTADLSSSNAKSGLMGDLVVRPVRSSTVENLAEELFSSDQILHGLLRIQVMGVDLGDAPKGPKHSITDMILKPDMLQDLPEIQEEGLSEGLFCVFTINGGNSRAETTIQPIIPRRPVKWEEGEDFLFYTSQARQVFVMCRKKKLNDTNRNSKVALGGRRTGATRDSCIGAAILSLSDLKTSPVSSTNSTNSMIEVFRKQQLEAVTLPLQPKGRILLRTSFSGKLWYITRLLIVICP